MLNYIEGTAHTMCPPGHQATPGPICSLFLCLSTCAHVFQHIYVLCVCVCMGVRVHASGCVLSHVLAAVGSERLM